MSPVGLKSWLPRGLHFLLLLWSLVGAAGDLEVVKLERTINLSNQIVRTHVTVTVRNVGEEGAGEILLGLTEGQASSLGFVRAAVIPGKKSDAFIPINAGLVEAPGGSNVSFVGLQLAAPLPPGSLAKVEVYLAFSGQLAPFPSEISQQDRQLALFHDTHYVLMPYLVKEQITSVTLPKGSVLKSYTKKSPSKKAGDTVRFGPYHNVAALAASHLAVHFSFDSPMLIVGQLLREVEISHWGNIYVTEQYTMRHAGAKLKGTFSRLEFDSQHSTGNGAVRSVVARLPPRVHSVYYRDSIGNISTSRVLFHPGWTDVELEPRYPLLGGWTASFSLGYSLPLEDFVARAADGRRVLNMTFGCPLHNVIVEELVTKVILPEGSTAVEARADFAFEQRREKKFTYLDIGGRPVVVLERPNVVDEFQGLHFQVSYRFAAFEQLAEPLMLVAAFAAFFAACAAYVRLDFRISKAAAA